MYGGGSIIRCGSTGISWNGDGDGDMKQKQQHLVLPMKEENEDGRRRKEKDRLQPQEEERRRRLRRSVSMGTRLASAAREQRARLYIMRRCVSMLVRSWKHHD